MHAVARGILKSVRTGVAVGIDAYDDVTGIVIAMSSSRMRRDSNASTIAASSILAMMLLSLLSVFACFCDMLCDSLHVLHGCVSHCACKRECSAMLDSKILSSSTSAEPVCISLRTCADNAKIVLLLAHLLAHVYP